MARLAAALDFAALPPEINSARMYSGAGSGPMLAAASAWNGLAAELRSTVLSYDAILRALTTEEWFGPASAAMAAAVTPYVAWMSATATQAEKTAAQAASAAGAYEVAFAATVSPQVVAANRTLLAALTATNVLGQNTPAIAAAEAQYLEIWAQDAAAMYGYAGSSAVATQLSSFAEPGPGGASAAGQQNGLTQLVSAVPGALQSLSGSNGGTGLSALQSVVDEWGPNANVWNTITSSGFFNPGATIGTLSDAVGASAVKDVAGAAQDAAPDAVGALVNPIESAGGLRGVIAAGAGGAGSVGKLSVPPAWTAAAPLAGPLHSALGGTPMVAPPPMAGATGMPGVPLGNIAGQPFGRAVPQYGFRPNFVVRPPSAG